uniref:Glycosyl transferase family 51 n=1 Tax=Geobacillus sp. (strain WCH70) TaxID=471223 RepID=C5D2D0_GEOSW
MEQSRWQTRKNKRKSYWKRAGIIVALFLIGSYIAVQAYIATRDISKLDHPLPAPTIIYDQNGRVASKVSVSIERIPKHFLEAIIATEDRRFYDHEGIDYFGILRALVHNMKALEWAEAPLHSS